ncbi:MAG TPA: hypothetical protein VMG35_15930 [Bryobacteraceae bacterium]|nr:hypothetical protein [Bryobacteraceae bacterium]
MRNLSVWLLSAGMLCAQVDFSALKELKYRDIGPFRGGRAVAVAGVTSQPSTYYFGATGGGIWKTTDSGATWVPVSDGQVKSGSVGALAVSESDPNVIYAGMGEACVRGNAANGDGVYKSVDSGKTWKHMGLADTYHIGRIVIHPRNPDIVFVAALGHLFGPNEERGVYRSKDGGKTWRKLLYRDADTGAVDLAMDPSNPNLIFATLWQIRRKPWTFESGGKGSGLFESTDGGDTWNEITRNEGLPKGILGRIGVTISPADPERVWAIVEAAEGGVYRSDDGGKKWQKTNSDNTLRQRAWYYSHIFADPKSADTVYVLNTSMWKSVDGGRKFSMIRAPHGDRHALWIAPNDPDRMIESDDGGATISTNGGKTWSTEDNQPTAQFYRVALDDDYPYHVYGAQQDNTTVRIASRSDGRGIGERDWYPVGGGESGWVAPDPHNSQIVYAGSYDGLLTRYDHSTEQMRNITVWPDNPMGYGAEGMKYRFQWNFPLLFSVHDPSELWAGGNILFETTDEGHSWKPISPDLTRNDLTKQGPAGGDITKDNSGVEYYDTIFTVAESPLQKGLIWAGSDDGLVHVTRDGGQHWTDVTPKALPEWNQINSIEASPHDAQTAYVAATMYKWDDFHPYLFVTHDTGKTWTAIDHGIPDHSFTRVVREDPNHKGLLVAGTETGMFISFNGGADWQPFQLNLPVVPITDLAFHKREQELVVATQGRSFWVLDDVPLLYQLSPEVLKEPAHLFQPADAVRGVRGGFEIPSSRPVGQNPAGGVTIYYSLAAKPAEKEEITLEILDSHGKLVKRYSNIEKKDEGPADPEAAAFGPPRGPQKLPAAAGLNRFVWNLRYEDATRFPGLIMWAGNVQGPTAAPGQYTAKLTVAGQSQTQVFQVRPDPRLKTRPEDYAAQLALALQIRDKLSAVNQAVIEIREAKKELARFEREDKVKDAAKSLDKKLTGIEDAIYQTKLKAGEDALNFPIKLNNKLAALKGDVEESDTAPTRQEQEVFEDLATQSNAELDKLKKVLAGDLPAFNKQVRDANIPAIEVKSSDQAR